MRPHVCVLLLALARPGLASGEDLSISDRWLGSLVRPPPPPASVQPMSLELGPRGTPGTDPASRTPSRFEPRRGPADDPASVSLPAPAPETPRFPGFGPESIPDGFRVDGWAARLVLLPGEEVLEAETRLRLRPDSRDRTTYALWLDPAVEVLGIETPWGRLEVARRGPALTLELPYRPYRDLFEIRIRTRIEGPGTLPLLASGGLYAPVAAGPFPGGDLELVTPTGRSALVPGRLAGRAPDRFGTAHRFVLPVGALPGMQLGGWELAAGSRCELLVPLGLGAGAEEVVRFLDGVIARTAAILGLPDSGRLVAVVPEPGKAVPSRPGLLVLDPDQDWSRSWSSLAERAVHGLRGLDPGATAWVDEALARVLVRQAVPRGAAGAPPPRPEAFREGRMQPRPRGGWSRAVADWTEDSRSRGELVLRGLSRVLGPEGWKAVLAALGSRQGVPTGGDELQGLVSDPAARRYLQLVTDQGQGLDFRIEEIRAGAAVVRDGSEGSAFTTRVRLRLSRGLVLRAPVPVVLHTDLGKVSRRIAWERPDQEFEVTTRSRVRRVEIDPAGWYPDPDRANNRLAHHDLYTRSDTEERSRGG